MVVVLEMSGLAVLNVGALAIHIFILLQWSMGVKCPVIGHSLWFHEKV